MGRRPALRSPPTTALRLWRARTASRFEPRTWALGPPSVLGPRSILPVLRPRRKWTTQRPTAAHARSGRLVDACSWGQLVTDFVRRASHIRSSDRDTIAETRSSASCESHSEYRPRSPPRSLQCEEQDSNLHVQRTLEPIRTQGALLSSNSLRKDTSAEVPGSGSKTHSGQVVAGASDVVTMSEVRACAKALVPRVAAGGEIPIASLRELGNLVLRSELIALSRQLLDRPPEFAVRRTLELASLVLNVRVVGDRFRGGKRKRRVKRAQPLKMGTRSVLLASCSCRCRQRQPRLLPRQMLSSHRWSRESPSTPRGHPVH